MIIVGVAFMVALLFDTATPPRAAVLIDTFALDNLTPPLEWLDGNVGLLALPFYDFRPPFTIEVEARSTGRNDSGWGLWLRVGDSQANFDTFAMLIDRQGYMLWASENSTFEHHQFTHFQPETSGISVHVGSYSRITFRVNNEIIQEYFFPTAVVLRGGLAVYGDPKLTEEAIKIYTGG